MQEGSLVQSNLETSRTLSISCINQDKNTFSLVGAILSKPMVKIATVNMLLRVVLGIPR